LHTVKLKIHPLTGLVTRSWQEAAVLLNDNFNHFNRLQKFAKAKAIPDILYPSQSELYLPLLWLHCKGYSVIKSDISIFIELCSSIINIHSIL
jgi:hypothetical protein